MSTPTVTSSTPSVALGATESKVPVADEKAINGTFHLLRVVQDQIYRYEHPCSTVAADEDLKRGGWKDWSSQFAALLGKRVVMVNGTKVILPSGDTRDVQDLAQNYVCYSCGNLMLNPSRMIVKMDSGSTFSCNHLACEVCWQEVASGECIHCTDSHFVQDISYDEAAIESIAYVKDEALTMEINKLQLLCNCGNIRSLDNCSKGIHHHCTVQDRKSPFSKLRGLITLDKLHNLVTAHVTESWQLLHALDSIVSVKVKGNQDDSQLNGLVGTLVKRPTVVIDDELSDVDDVPDLIPNFDEFIQQMSKPTVTDDKLPSALNILSSPLAVPVPIPTSTSTAAPTATVVAPTAVPLERRTLIIPFPPPAQAQAQDLTNDDESTDYEGDESTDYEGDDYEGDDDYDGGPLTTIEPPPVVVPGVRPTL